MPDRARLRRQEIRSRSARRIETVRRVWAGSAAPVTRSSDSQSRLRLVASPAGIRPGARPLAAGSWGLIPVLRMPRACRWKNGIALGDPHPSIAWKGAGRASALETRAAARAPPPTGGMRGRQCRNIVTRSDCARPDPAGSTRAAQPPDSSRGKGVGAPPHRSRCGARQTPAPAELAALRSVPSDRNPGRAAPPTLRSARAVRCSGLVIATARWRAGPSRTERHEVWRASPCIRELRRLGRGRYPR